MSDHLQVVLEGCDQQYPFQDTDAKQRDETNPRRDAEVGARDQQGENASHDSRRHVEEDQSGILQVTEHDKQQQEDQEQADRNDLAKPLGRALLVLEVALPYHAVAFLQLNSLVYLLLRLFNSAAHIPAPDRELDGRITAVVVPEDQTGPGLLCYSGDLADRNF